MRPLGSTLNICWLVSWPCWLYMRRCAACKGSYLMLRAPQHFVLASMNYTLCCLHVRLIIHSAFDVWQCLCAPQRSSIGNRLDDALGSTLNVAGFQAGDDGYRFWNMLLVSASGTAMGTTVFPLAQQSLLVVFECMHACILPHW